MRWISKFSVAAMLVATSAFAQLSVETRTAQQLTGLGETEQIGDAVFVASGAELQLQNVILVTCDTEAANIVFEASDEDRVPVNFDQLTDNTIAIRTPGKIWVDCTAIDFEKNIYGRRMVVVQLDEDPDDNDDNNPTPPPPPDPDLDNKYGVGLVAFQNAPRLGAKDVAKLYRATADMLYGRPRAMTIDTALKYLDQEIPRIAAGGDQDGWRRWVVAVDMALLESQRKQPNGYTMRDWYGAFSEIADALDKVK